MAKSFEEIRRNAEVTINAGKINLSDDAYDNSFVSNAHFVYELLQNADDAKASEITFELFRDKLVVTHNGERKFNLDDVDSITSIKQSTKKSDNDTIGKFGIGFKSVFKYTNKPEIQSGDFAFNITHIILPTKIPKKEDLGDNTEVTIPFNRGNPNESYLEIKEKLSQLSEDSIMFIERIGRINIIYDEINIIISKSVDNVKKISEQISSNIVTISSSDENKKYYCFTFSGLELNDGDKIITNQEVKIAYLLNDDGNIIKDERHQFFVYFPTNIDTDLPYLVHAPFQTLEGRSLLQKCKLNDALYEKIGELVFESIVELKNREMLNTDFYDKFIIIDGNSASEPIVNSIKNNLIKSIENGSEILPVLPNGYSSIDKILIYDYYIKSSNSNEFNLVEKTFSPTEISDYAVNYSGHKFWGSNYSAKLRNFMMGIDRNVSIDFDKILKLFNSKWLETKSIDDIKRIYMIIAPPNKNGELGDIIYPLNNYYTSYSKKTELRSYPLIRDTQNYHISVDSGNVYLNNNSINQMLLDDPYCHSFITEILGVKEYSKKDKSIDDAKLILSKYDDNESAKKITASENIDDLKKLREYISKYYIDENEVKNHKIIYADRCDKKESCWHTPEDIYLTVKMGGDEFTEKLLSGIDSAYFLSERYYEKYNNDDDFITLIKTYITPNLEPIPIKMDSYTGAYYTDNIFKNGAEATPDIKEWLEVYSNRTIYIKPTENTSPDFNPYLDIPHLMDITNYKNNTFDRSIILFRYLIRYASRISDEVKYNSNKSFAETGEFRGVKKLYSYMGFWISNTYWLYDKNNKICLCSPNSVDISELNEKYSEISKDLLLKLGVQGIASEKIKEIIYDLSPEDKRRTEALEDMNNNFTTEELEEMSQKKKAEKKKAEKIGLSPEDAFLKHNIKDSGDAKNYNSDKIYSGVKNTQKYSENIEKEIGEQSTNEPRTKIKTQSIIVDDNKTEKEFLKSEYSGKCQICGKEIIKRDETPFFVVHKLDKDLNPKYINSRDVGWDSICVCPNCDAELKNCPNNISSAILNAFKNSTDNNFESGTKISFDFWGEKREIKLTQRHILRIIAAFKSFDEKDKDE